jgi:hypothetical protein
MQSVGTALKYGNEKNPRQLQCFMISVITIGETYGVDIDPQRIEDFFIELITHKEGPALDYVGEDISEFFKTCEFNYAATVMYLSSVRVNPLNVFHANIDLMLTTFILDIVNYIYRLRIAVCVEPLYSDKHFLGNPYSGITHKFLTYHGVISLSTLHMHYSPWLPQSKIPSVFLYDGLLFNSFHQVSYDLLPTTYCKTC